MRVELTLVAKDLAGQSGRSKPVEIVLPERRFTKPLARAVIEQRRRWWRIPATGCRSPGRSML